MNDVFLGFSRSFIRILVKIKFVFVFLVMTICLPGISYFVFLPVGQGISEDSNSFQMSKIGVFETFSKVTGRPSTSDIGIMFQVDNFGKKSTFEFSSGFFKIFFVPSAFAEEVGKQCSDSRASKTEQETDGEIVQYDLSSLFAGYVMGLVSVIFGMLLYYGFVQNITSYYIVSDYSHRFHDC